MSRQVRDEQSKEGHEQRGGDRSEGPQAHRSPRWDELDRHVHILTGVDSQRPDIVGRVGRADFGSWLRGAVAAGGCAAPVRLRPLLFKVNCGTGELVPSGDALADAPDGVVYKACDADSE